MSDEVYMSDVYNYLNEAVIIDKIKSVINSLKDKKKEADETGNKAEQEEVAAEVKELKSKISSNKSLGSSAKKALMISLMTIMGGMATNANAGVCQISDRIENGKHVVTTIGDCSKEDIQDLQNYKASVKAKLGSKASRSDDANHLALLYNSKLDNGIKVIARKVVDKGTNDEQTVVKFNDGTGVVYAKSGHIVFFDTNGKPANQYDWNDCEALAQEAISIARH